MGRYVLKRLLAIIPFAFIAILIVFLLFESSWQIDLESIGQNNQFNQLSAEKIREIQCQKRQELHLDWPLFYVSIESASIPTDIRQYCDDSERELLKWLCLQNGNSSGAKGFVKDLRASKNLNSLIFNSRSFEEIEYHLKDATLSTSFENYQSNVQNWKIFLPRIQIHPTKNRFHAWLSKVIFFDFGRSSLDNQIVSGKINNALVTTLLFTIPAVLIIFFISVMLGYLLSKPGRLSNSILTNILYFIDAIPLIWLSIIILLCATILGIGYSTLDIGNDSIGAIMQRNSLPILALVLASMPYISKQVQKSIEENSDKPFVLNAKAKGLSNKQVFFKHILPNASMPIITLFFDYLALAFGGAFVVEWVFSISGIGKLMADSVLASDINVISAMIIYLILIKMLLTLVSDVVQFKINPSIRFGS